MSVEVPVQGIGTRLGTEASITNNSAAATDTVVGTTLTYYSFFTLPTTAPLYTITGIEWKNGTVVNGTIMAAVHLVDASPPTINASSLVTQILQTAQSGANAVQRASTVGPNLIRGGTLIGVGVVSNSATGRLLTLTVSNANNTRAIAFTQATLTGSSVAWAATTEEIYCKLYYQPVL